MLKNFLDALVLTGADKKLKRVLLTTGAKQYGVHLGPAKNPMEESDPWVENPESPPNFYYHQQRILEEAARGKSWDWVWLSVLTINLPHNSHSCLVLVRVTKSIAGGHLSQRRNWLSPRSEFLPMLENSIAYILNLRQATS